MFSIHQRLNSMAKNNIQMTWNCKSGIRWSEEFRRDSLLGWQTCIHVLAVLVQGLDNSTRCLLVRPDLEEDTALAARSPPFPQKGKPASAWEGWPIWEVQPAAVTVHEPMATHVKYDIETRGYFPSASVDHTNGT
jgi:hypothetical protein